MENLVCQFVSGQSFDNAFCKITKIKTKKEEVGKFAIDEIWYRRKEKKQKKNLSGY
ncbi:unnamed protein product [marine sediment metagenome]|uniref:Uncharacterized protein n=1 Tax=marine sediment metagenome TaxID=412755 RepID=X0YWU3_9ZZZZ